MLRVPPALDMGASDCLQRLDPEPGAEVFGVAANIKNCFYQCGVEADMRPYFCFQDQLSPAGLHVTQGESPIRWIGPASGDGSAFLALNVLPMGFS